VILLVCITQKPGPAPGFLECLPEETSLEPDIHHSSTETRRRDMTNEQQALADMPIWLVILLAVVGGVSGEMWRADKEGARGWSLLRRLALRSGACMICGVSAIMLLYAAGLSIWAAGAFGCLTAMAGADVAIGLYERWAAKRIGVCEVPPPRDPQ